MTEETQSVLSIFPKVLDGDRKPHLCIVKNIADNTFFFVFTCVVTKVGLL